MPDTCATRPIPLDPPRLAHAPPVLVAEGLTKRYGRVTALAGVSLSVYPGEILGVVGESGSGKSTLLRLLNLEESPDSGQYTLRAEGLAGTDLFGLDRFGRRQVRSRHIGIVYQNPRSGLRMSCSSGGNVAERLILAGRRNYAAMRAAAGKSLTASEFPADRLDDPPATLSGGMQQRVQLAKAIALEPSILLLDEPTTGLDVSVQALVLDTLKRLQRRTGVSVVLVSHDLGVIRAMADRVMVMKAGECVEAGLADQILDDPTHTYSQQLVQAKI